MKNLRISGAKLRDKEKILIYDKVLTRKEMFERQEDFRKEIAKLPFEEKIRILVNLQKLAQSWGKRKDVIVWKI
jgi:hypothetical protein